MNETTLDYLVQTLIKEKKDLSIDSLWDIFITHSKVRCREATIIRYNKDFKQISTFFHDNKIITVNEINEHVIDKFIYFKKLKGCKNVTINQQLDVLRFAINYATKKKYINHNPLADIEKLTNEKFNGTVTAKDDLQKLFDYIDNIKIQDRYKLRNITCLFIMLDTGIRPNELCNIKIADLYLHLNEIKLSYTKAYDNRSIFISNSTKNYIQKYICVYDPKNYLFYDADSQNKNKQLNSLIVRRFLKDLKEKLQISSDFNARELRRTFATHFVDNDVNSFELMKLMGHSNIRTTQKYYVANNNKLKNTHKVHSIINSINARS